jgi:hypothetical protein
LLRLRKCSQGLGSEACCTHAHLDSGFAHPIESIAACLCWWAFVDQVTQDGGCCQYREVYIV